MVSTVIHVTLVYAAVVGTLKAAVAEEEEDVYVELTQQMKLPEPPPPPPPPEMQQVVRGFQTLTVPTVVLTEIPPPGDWAFTEADFTGEGILGGVLGAADDTTETVASLETGPAFTPFTLAPTLTNRAEVGDALTREYPPLLRDAGIGGRVLVWFFIDENGAVQGNRLVETSGHAALDEAALKVASVMRFTAAKNRDKNVPVWVQIPITFQVR
jgi:protein TonB